MCVKRVVSAQVTVPSSPSMRVSLASSLNGPTISPNADRLAIDIHPYLCFGESIGGHYGHLCKYALAQLGVRWSTRQWVPLGWQPRANGVMLSPTVVCGSMESASVRDMRVTIAGKYRSCDRELYTLDGSSSSPTTQRWRRISRSLLKPAWMLCRYAFLKSL